MSSSGRKCNRRSIRSDPHRSSTTTNTRRHAGSNAGVSPSSEPLKTLVGNDIYAAEEVVKKSRFIGYASRCADWDDAKTIIESVRREHPKCRHVCFGFVSSGAGAGGGAGTERSSDGGEPTGTAGAPILGAVKGEGLSETLCVVVRYFGGVKLGAGGLIRAYGGAARGVLRSAPSVVLVPSSTFRLSTRAANAGAVYSTVAKFGGTPSGETYNDRGELEVTVTCDQESGHRLKQAIVDATRGGVLFME